MDIQLFCIQNKACIRIVTNDVEPKDEHEQHRNPIHFCTVLDISGSMEDLSKLDNVKKSLSFMIERMTANDRLSIVTFSDNAECYLPPTFINAEQKNIINQKISNISAEGSTNLSAGILMSKQYLLKNEDNIKQGIIILTDGHANMGITVPEKIIEIEKSLLDEYKGTTIHCVGYGSDHNAELLKDIATEGSGSYNVVNNIEDIATVFGDIVGGLSSCAFQQVSVKLPDGVKQITKYASRDNTVIVGDIYDQNEVIIVGDGECPYVIMEGFNIKNMKHFTKEVKLIDEPDPELLWKGRVAILRAEVVNLMQTIRNSLASFNDPTHQINILLEEITSMISEHSEDALLLLLRDELLTAKNAYTMTQIQPDLTPRLQQMLSQHEMYVGQGRGIRQTPEYEDPLQTRLTSLFSNTVQRQFSEDLRTMVAGINSSEYTSSLSPPPPLPAVVFGRQIAYSEDSNGIDPCIVFSQSP